MKKAILANAVATVVGAGTAFQILVAFLIVIFGKEDSIPLFIPGRDF